MAQYSEWLIEPRFTSDLSAREEVPPTDSEATGSALFRQVGRRRVSYTLSADIRGVTQAHIHKGRRGVNGPIVAWLYGPTQPRNVKGIFASGTITRRDLVGPLRGKPISSLIRLLKERKAYVNVHTRRFPEGAIRGQIHTAGKTAVRTPVSWWRDGGYSV